MTLKPSRLWLAALVAVSVICLIALLLGYVPSAIARNLTAASRADYFASALSVIVTVIGVAIAGFITLEQLDNEREDRRKERRLAAKHAALMDVVRGMNKMIGQIARLAVIETEDEVIGKAYGEGASQAAPGWAVADLPTVAHLQRLNNEISMTFISLNAKRRELVAMNDDCEATDKAIKTAHGENKRLFLLHTEAIGAGDDASAKRWNELFRIAVGQMPAMRDELRRMQEDFGKARTPFTIKCLMETRRLAAKYQKLVSHIREEIEVDAPDSLDQFLKSADLEDRMVLRTLRTVIPPEYHEELERAAVSAGCNI